MYKNGFSSRGYLMLINLKWRSVYINGMVSEDLERVLKKVMEESMMELKSVMESGEAEAMALIDAASMAASEEASSMLDAAKRQAEAEGQRILSMAELEAKRQHLNAIDEYVNLVIRRAVERLKDAHLTDGYRDAMRELLVEALDAIGEDMVACTNREGLAMLSELARELSGSRGIRISVGEPIECVAGIRAFSSDGKKVFDNTVEGRLQRMRPMLRKEIARILCSE